MVIKRIPIITSAMVLASLTAAIARAQFPEPGSGASDTETAQRNVAKSPFGAPPGAKPLSDKEKIWVDLKRNAVYVDGVVAMTDGPPIEMFACPAGTKEHESIVAVHAKSFMVHAGLLAAKAEAGRPVQIEPEYVPASGTKIDVLVEWIGADGKRHKAPAQNWVRHIRTGKALDQPWVFAGSGFWKDDEGKEHYHADSGDLICVSNFQTAMLDLPVASSKANADLLYEAFTENIPPKGTPVRLVLLPRLHDMKDVPEKKEGEKPAAEDAQGKPDESKSR
jgi:hypothetical protein